jgi:hypothetical protein
MSDPITVVTIAGSGRSGSTILSLLLSQDATVFNLGQMRDIWAAWNDDAPCSCDHTLRNCPVYGTAVPRALARAGITDAQEAAHLGYAFFKAATRLRDWGDEVLRAELAARHAPYLAALQYLLLDIARETGAHAFIDSSKSPEMALAIDCLDGVEMRLLHLQRDPRAVACSWYRKKSSYRKTLRNMRIWARRQSRLEQWAHSLGPRYHALRYEIFSAHPRTAIADALSWADLPAAGTMFTDDSRVRLSWAGQHLFPPANETVLNERRCEVEIQPAEAWRAPENRRLHWLALAGTWPSARSFFRGA